MSHFRLLLCDFLKIVFICISYFMLITSPLMVVQFISLSLDASKAFDRVRHVKLFDKLIDRGLPGNIIKMLIDWHGKAFFSVKWNNRARCYTIIIAYKVRTARRPAHLAA